MAISNIQETLLMYTKQKSMLNNKLSDVMFDLLNASKDSSEVQSKYNDKIQEYYYLYMQDGIDETYYQEITEQLEKEREFELANLNSWETELELDKNNYETRLNVRGYLDKVNANQYQERLYIRRCTTVAYNLIVIISKKRQLCRFF